MFLSVFCLFLSFFVLVLRSLRVFEFFFCWGGGGLVFFSFGAFGFFLSLFVFFWGVSLPSFRGLGTGLKGFVGFQGKLLVGQRAVREVRMSGKSLEKAE